MAPDAVVVATGGRPYIPEFPGVESPNVITAIDLFSGAAVAGEKVIVVGGMDDHIGAPTAAEFLADQGKEVELISEQVDLSLGAEHPTRYLLFKRLLTKGVTISMMTRIQSFDAPGATLLQTFTRRERKVRRVDTRGPRLRHEGRRPPGEGAPGQDERACPHRGQPRPAAHHARHARRRPRRTHAVAEHETGRWGSPNGWWAYFDDRQNCFRDVAGQPVKRTNLTRVMTAWTEVVPPYL